MSTQVATFADDTLTYNPADYVDAGTTILPSPGTYRVRVTSLGRLKDRETGEEILRDGWPTLKINRIEIVEPTEEQGGFAVFENISTKPYMRKAGGGRELPAARHMDLLRAIDQNIHVADFHGGIEEVERLLSQGQTFVVQLGYQNQDTDWAKAQISAAGGKESMDKEVYNKVWSDAKLTTKDFKNGPGSYRLQTVGRSGKLIDAKLTLAKFIPSEQADSTVLGPFTK